MQWNDVRYNSITQNIKYRAHVHETKRKKLTAQLNIYRVYSSGSNSLGIHPPLASFFEQVAFQDNEQTASWLFNLSERI